MKTKHNTLILVISLLFLLEFSFPMQARDFTYVYEGQRINYTVIDEDAKTCMTRPGSKSSNGTHVTPGSSLFEGALILPEHPMDGEEQFTLIEIGDYSFSYSYSITSLIIPNSVLSIGQEAFIGCTGFTAIELSDALINIGDFAFYYCPNIESSVSIPADVSVIGQDAFAGCARIPSIQLNNNVTTIKSGAFSGCKSLTSIYIPDSVTIIGESAFAGCNGLEKAEFSSIEALCNIQFEGIVANTNPLSLAKHLYIDGREVFDVVIPDGLTAIRNSTFIGASFITSVILPESVMTIGENAFSGCESLRSINLQSVTTIYRGAFGGCFSLTSLDLSDGLTYIGESAFMGCKGLKYVQIPNSITSIEYGSFGWCTNLKSIILGNSVKYIGNSAFQDSKNLELLYSLNTVPPEMKDAYYSVFDFNAKDAIMYVPEESKVLYESSEAWSAFKNIREIGNLEVSLDKSSLTISGDETVKINPIITENDGAIIIFEHWSSSNEVVAIVDDGVVRGLSNGIAVITFSVTDILNNVYKASCKVTVGPTPVESISLGDTPAVLRVGEVVTLSAIVLPETATDRTVVWSSDNPSVATVDENGTVTPIAPGDVTITVNCGDVSASCSITVVPTPVESISISHTAVDLKVGEAITLNATVFPEDATDKKIVWTSDNTSVATVDEAGNVTAVSIGVANVYASCGDVSVSCVVSVVISPVESISISQESVTLHVGESIVLNATIYPENATDKLLVWNCDNQNVAYVDAEGKVTAVSIGSAIVTVTSGDGKVCASCVVTVVPIPVEHIILSESSASLKVGESVALTVTVLPEYATDKTVLWNSDNPAVARVDDSGNVVAMSLGTATVTASCGDVRATCFVSVVSTPAECIVLSQNSASLYLEETIQLKATVLPDEATDKMIVWYSDDTSVATVDEFGNVTAVFFGTATITASCGDVSASCIVSVVAVPVDGIAIIPESAQIKIGESLLLSVIYIPENATYKYQVWTSDNPSVATVDEFGIVTGISLGSATIVATHEDFNATCTITVIPTPAESITLSQESVSLRAGEGFDLYATVLPDDATDKSVLWHSDDISIATVNEMGYVIAVGVGTTMISASCCGLSASCVVNVVATPVESILLNYDTAVLRIGEIYPLAATVLPDNATNKAIVWSSDNPIVASVDENATVRALSVGSAIIYASATDGSGVSASCHVTVLPKLVESIQLSPDSWSGEEGESFRIEAIVLPEDATDKSLIWSSSDDTIAIVDSEGLVSILKEGNCVITATATDGSGVSAECLVTGLSGIEEMFSDSDQFDIYDLNGILIKKDSDRETLKLLTPGIYIIRIGNTMKKIVIR